MMRFRGDLRTLSGYETDSCCDAGAISLDPMGGRVKTHRAKPPARVFLASAISLILTLAAVAFAGAKLWWYAVPEHAASPATGR